MADHPEGTEGQAEGDRGSEAQGASSPDRIGLPEPGKNGVRQVARDEHGGFLPGNEWRNGPGEGGPARHNQHSIVAPLKRLLGARPNEHGEGRLAVEVAEILAGIATGRFTASDLHGARLQLQALFGIVDRVDRSLLKKEEDTGQVVKRVILEERSVKSE